jgi:hypothetical protein
MELSREKGIGTPRPGFRFENCKCDHGNGNAEGLCDDDEENWDEDFHDAVEAMLELEVDNQKDGA